MEAGGTRAPRPEGKASGIVPGVRTLGRRSFVGAALGAAAACALGGRAWAQPARERLRLAIVAKSQNNLVFQAAWRGARDAAQAVGAARALRVEPLWRTPRLENAQEQAQILRALLGEGVDGVAVSAVDPRIAAPAIDALVAAGIPVMCFDGDAPDSARFAYYGENNVEIGTRVIDLLAQELGGRGTIALLIANETSRTGADRMAGAKAALRRHSGITSVGRTLHSESFAAGRDALRKAHASQPEIDGWAMLSAFPLFDAGGLPWGVGGPKVVSVDALPPQLDYVRMGLVQALVAQNCYAWGTRSVELLASRILDGVTPADPRIIAPLEVVGPDDVPEWERRWDRWLRRRPGR